MIGKQKTFTTLVGIFACCVLFPNVYLSVIHGMNKTRLSVAINWYHSIAIATTDSGDIDMLLQPMHRRTTDTCWFSRINSYVPIGELMETPKLWNY